MGDLGTCGDAEIGAIRKQSVLKQRRIRTKSLRKSYVVRLSTQASENKIGQDQRRLQSTLCLSIMRLDSYSAVTTNDIQ